MSSPAILRPDWPAPAGVGAVFTLRTGGVSRGPWGAVSGEGGFNLGAACGDDPAAVAANRAALTALLPSAPRWLNQVHGPVVVDAASVTEPVPADASFSDAPGVVCAVMVADCMPVLLADRHGRVVGAAHAGWRGLAGGVIQATAAAMRDRLGDPAAELVAWLGPAIGPAAFEVGDEVRAAMIERLSPAGAAFVEKGNGKWLADLFTLGRQALASCGVDDVAGGGQCTVGDAERFFSFRRDRVTGRHAALIWIEPKA